MVIDSANIAKNLCCWAELSNGLHSRPDIVRKRRWFGQKNNKTGQSNTLHDTPATPALIAWTASMLQAHVIQAAKELLIIQDQVHMELTWERDLTT